MAKKVNLPRLLRKIELYCILHNIKDWENVPYHCFGCIAVTTKNCSTRSSEGFKFRSNLKFRKFKVGHIQTKNYRNYTGCLLWKGKNKI